MLNYPVCKTVSFGAFSTFFTVQLRTKNNHLTGHFYSNPPQPFPSIFGGGGFLFYSWQKLKASQMTNMAEDGLLEVAMFLTASWGQLPLANIGTVGWLSK